ncbi:MAG: MgtC/SapB family protein [Christensenellaceae bacterium]|nr:MgtC/SapB family protein [Christensenellaceae bacterium]
MGNTLYTYFKDVNLGSTILRLVLAMIMGGILGLERDRKRRPAGLRTYMIVCMASALVMITGQYIVDTFGEGDRVRLGAQVISGIGFLGAGTIIVTHRQVTGLTTAAGLWASACIGLALGGGFYSGGIIAGLLVFLIMTVMQHLTAKTQKNSKNMMFFIEVKSMSALSGIMRYLRETGIKINNIEINDQSYSKDGSVGAYMWIENQIKFDHDEFMETLSTIKGVKFIEELELN